MGDKPIEIEDIEPQARTFPAGWRDAAVRALFSEEIAGVRCARCEFVARRPSELRRLHCDHIVAYSKGGLSTWTNLQLLCGPCNLSKGAND
ncbi:MAG: HNH endonuclease [Hyphomonadaceae bacterium]|nr:HNH endonuclease [Hyphomonadaceae bacterium]